MSKISLDFNILQKPPADLLFSYLTGGSFTATSKKIEIKIVIIPINATTSRHPNIPTKYVNGDDPSKLPNDPIPRKAAANVEKTFGE